MTNNLADTSPTLPPILYKYMSQAGFLGIINSQSIWATDIFYLNDAAEYHHSVGLIKSEIENKSKDIAIPLTGFSGAKLDTVRVVHKKDVTTTIVQEAATLDPKPAIWFMPGTQSKESVAICEDNNMKIASSCINGHRMFTGWKRFFNMHNFHAKVGGMNRIPKQG